LIFGFLFATEGGHASEQSWRLVRRILAFGIPLLILMMAFFCLVCAVAELGRLDDALGDWVVLIAALGALWAVAWIAVPGWGRMRAGRKSGAGRLYWFGSTCAFRRALLLGTRLGPVSAWLVLVGTHSGARGRVRHFWRLLALAVMLISRFTARRTPTTGD
jgi:hypothetical protein